jgi:hypothetical protein
MVERFMNSEILGFLAIAALIVAFALGYKTPRKEPKLKEVIGILLFVSVGALATSFIRQPLFDWSLGIAMIAAMIFLVRMMYAQARSGRR